MCRILKARNITPEIVVDLQSKKKTAFSVLVHDQGHFAQTKINLFTWLVVAIYCCCLSSLFVCSLDLEHSL